MVKIEQTGGRLTEEEILHGKNDAYGIYQINWKGEDGSMPFSPLILYGQKEKHQKEKIISLCTVTFWKQTKTETACL